MALKTWIGANGGLWTTAGNWSPSGAPGIGDDALFSSNSSGASITSTSNCKSLTITGSNVTISGTSTLNIYGNITVNSTTGVSATGTWNILNTFGQTTYDIISAGVTFNCNLTLNAGTSSTYRLVKADSSANGNFTMSNIKTLTLTTGILNLNGFNLSVGLFSSSNSNTRSITFSSDHSNFINLTGVGTVFSLTTSAGWSYTGFSDFTVSNATSTTKTVTTTGMSSYPANFYFTNAGTVTLTSGNWFLILDASAMTGTLSKSSSSVMTIGASLLFTSGTSAIGGSGVTTFSLVSGLGGSLATGTLDLGGRNWGAMTFSSGAWKTEGSVGSPAAAEAVICSGGSLLIQWDFYCETFTVTGSGNVQLGFDSDAYLTCTETSTSAAAFAVTGGVFYMNGYGGVICNVAVISGGRIALDAYGYAIDCLRMNITGSATWQGLDPYNQIRYDAYSHGGIHIKQRTVVSNWNSASSFQSRYDSSSTNIVVMFTTFDTASSTLRSISDSSGMFAFCWDTHITNVQRFGIASGSFIGGLDIIYIDPSTFEGGYSFTCNGSYADNGPVFRTQGGTITFRGGTSTLPNYFFPGSSEFPWGVTFGSNGYFRLASGAFVQGIRTDSGFAFIMAGCTIESLGSTGSLAGVRMTFHTIILNQSGNNIFICTNPGNNTNFYADGASGTVIAAGASGLTFQGVSSPNFTLLGISALARDVYLPSESNYSFSLTEYPACSFSDVVGSSGEVRINDLVLRDVFLNSITLAGSSVYFPYNMIVQSYAVIATTQSTFFTRSLTVLGIVPAGQQSTFAKGVNNVFLGGIFIGNSTTNATNVALLFDNTSSNNNKLTINSGQVTFVPNSTRALLPNLVVNSINSSSVTTLTLLDGTALYRPYIQNLTLAATGTINFTSGTVLELDPLNPASTRTWELGGRTIEPTVIVSLNSQLDITDTANLGTTYIKNIVSTSTAVAPLAPTIVFNSTSGSGTFTHSYSSAAQTLTFSLNGLGLDSITMDLIYNITIPTGKSIAYSINYSISSESGYDVGSITISGATAVSFVSGSSSGTATGSTSISGTILIRYSKDANVTDGSDTFSGTITFSNVSESSTLRFQGGRTFTFDKFFHDPTVYALTLASTSSGTQTNLVIPERNLGTLVQGTNPGGVYTATIRDCVVTSTNFIWFAGKNSVDAGNNSGWIFGASPTTQTNIQFFL